RHGAPEVLAPHGGAGGAVEGVDVVRLGGDDHQVLAAGASVDEQGLRVDGAHDAGRGEGGVLVEGPDRRLGEGRLDVDAVSARVLVVHHHRLRAAAAGAPGAAAGAPGAAAGAPGAAAGAPGAAARGPSA